MGVQYRGTPPSTSILFYQFHRIVLQLKTATFSLSARVLYNVGSRLLLVYSNTNTDIMHAVCMHLAALESYKHELNSNVIAQYKEQQKE